MKADRRDYDILPERLCPGDLSSQDEAIPQPGPFFSVYQDVLQGRRPFRDAAALAREMGLDEPFIEDRRHMVAPPMEVPDEVLADVVEDYLPDFYLISERITGDPFTAPTVPVVAALAFVADLARGRRVVDAWGEQESNRRLSNAGKLLAFWPPGLFLDGQPLLSPRFLPTHAPAGLIVGRPYPVGDRWCWSSVFPARVSAEALRNRLRLEAWRMRAGGHQHPLSIEDIMRLRPEIVYRTALEGNR